MESASPDDGIIRVSTDQFPKRDRVAIWREVVAKGLRIDSEPVLGSEFRADVKSRLLSGIYVLSATIGGICDRRTPALVADGNDDVAFIFNSRGSVSVSVRSRNFIAEHGQAFAFSMAEASTVTRSQLGGVIGATIPRKVLAPFVRNLDDVLSRVIPANTEALWLLNTYLRALISGEPLQTAEVRQVAALHVGDLTALALGGVSRDAASFARNRGLAAARLRAIKADIGERVGDRNLTITRLAQRHRVSARYVQMLFEYEGTTFSEFLLEKRLARARRWLADPRLFGRPIAVIAFEAGFGDLSYFNRAFRRRYDATPSDVRASAARAASDYDEQ